MPSPIAGRRDLEVRDAHEAIREPQAQLLGDLVERRVRARDAAAVIDEQDRARHPARAACSSAWARSAHRSSACSMPTERRTTASLTPLRRFSSGGNARVAHRPRVADQRLDAAEALAEREQARRFAELARRRLAAAQLDREHAAEAAHLAARELVPRMLRQAGVVDARDLGAARRRNSATRAALRSCSRMRRASVFAPRSVSQASHGPGTPPVALRVNWSRFASSSSSTTMAPPITSECPPMYLVVECRATCAPSASGFWRKGVAKVLSTTSCAPRRRAISPQAAMSIEAQQRVGRALDPEHARRGLERLVDLLGPRRVDEAEADAEARHHLREEPVAAAVEVVGDDDVIAGARAAA